MESQVEKLYENAGIEKVYEYVGHYPKTDENGIILPMVYPPFTAEKQLELIKWLGKRLDFGLEYYQDKTWAVQTQLGWDGYEIQQEHKNFDEALSSLINHLWQSLTSAEKQQVKGILE